MATTAKARLRVLFIGGVIADVGTRKNVWFSVPNFVFRDLPSLDIQAFNAATVQYS